MTAINLETDGRFPRPPEPIAENLGELERLVLESGAAIGFAVDPDVDRLALVSDAGKAIGEDYTLALAARLVLRHRPRSGRDEPVDQPDRRRCGDGGRSAGDSGAGRRSERRRADAR